MFNWFWTLFAVGVGIGLAVTVGVLIFLVIFGPPVYVVWSIIEDLRRARRTKQDLRLLEIGLEINLALEDLQKFEGLGFFSNHLTEPIHADDPAYLEKVTTLRNTL
jgi:hypothetical protein